MNDFRLNFGFYYARPYESHYAVLRHFFVANAGIPISTLGEALRRLEPTQHGMINQILSRYPPEYKNRVEPLQTGKLHIKRHCPMCAKSLYHSDLYNLPWLKRCPIHHCAFTTECPDCHKPWPDVQELAQRDCSCCGTPVLSRFNDPLCLSNNSDVFQPIAKLYKFIHYKESQKLQIGSWYTHDEWIGIWEWWSEMSNSHPLFANAQIHRHPEFLPADLKPLHVDIKPIKCKSANLTGKSKHSIHEIPVNRREPFCLDVKKSSLTALRSDYFIMKRILCWINNHTNAQHQTHISNHRHLTLQDLHNAPSLCPYCMALSLWFFHHASRRYGFQFTINTDHYPFCAESGCVSFYDAFESDKVTLNEMVHYKIDTDFATWFHRRGLEITFVDIFCFVQHLQAIVNTDKNMSFANRRYADMACMIDIADTTMHFFYEHEHPLDQLTIEHIPYNDVCCREHHRYIRECLSIIVHFDFAIPTRVFTYRMFLSLHENFRQLINVYQ